MTRAPLLVMAGPSGVGKTTVAERFLAVATRPLRRAVTATTRPPRPGERPGIDYHFWTPTEFREAIAAGRMLEWAEVHGADFYGTPRAEVDPFRDTGTAVLLVIDVQGAGQIRAMEPDHLSVFLLPPCFASLRERLVSRGDTSEKIERRLRTATGELARAGEFDRLVVNADISAAVRILTHLTETTVR
jgi:guanylate kinase